MAPCLLPKISGVEVTPSVTSVESSEQFWRKYAKFGVFANPESQFRVLEFLFSKGQGKVQASLLFYSPPLRTDYKEGNSLNKESINRSILRFLSN